MASTRCVAEDRRLEEAREKGVPWRAWGPYLSERQWGTVREDYSGTGNSWDYLSHDQARSRAYRWGEDGLAGISDDKQNLCFALALWNGRDPIIKERLFGLTNSEGNHGEDVKEYYYYLDNTPTHSYMKYLYKYPQEPYPYDRLVRTNASLGKEDMEFELIDTGVFDEDRYFDVFVEYAKETPTDILVRITVVNRGDREAPLHVLPTLWFRNTWTWNEGVARPEMGMSDGAQAGVRGRHERLGEFHLACEGSPDLLFTENETNNERLFGCPSPTPHVKDAFHRYLVQGERDAVNPARVGTKCAAHYSGVVPAHGEVVLRLRIGAGSPVASHGFGEAFDQLFSTRAKEADEFYATITPANYTDDERRLSRQALAGMLWSKQYYGFDLDRWLREHGSTPMGVAPGGAQRNREWFHMVNDDVISMPDKWEYPWYAAWDLAFHTVARGMVDLDFAKAQLELMLQETYLHPNGQIPAYEWNFGDVNPPVHPWATIFLYRMESEMRGQGDLDFLKRVFNKLMMNFTWWVNRKDRSGRNVFEGGFLGLDNIGVFDRSQPLPGGGYLEQADGTAWMALYCQTMLQIAIELSLHDPTYEHLAVKFVEHFFWMSLSLSQLGSHGEGIWDEEDGFFYDVLRWPNGVAERLRVRSMVGLLPLCATTVYPYALLKERLPNLLEKLAKRVERYPELQTGISYRWPTGERGTRVLSLVNEEKLRRVLAVMLDEKEFLSPFGLRSLSRRHADEPYVFGMMGEHYSVGYTPAESTTGMFGGNSNWRGPIWFPVNVLVVRALYQLHNHFGDDFKVELPTGSGRYVNLFEVATEISSRLCGIFLLDRQGRRPVFGGARKFQEDPHFRDNLLFYEYFHGDNGAGLGASHQTGWTGLVAPLMHLYHSASASEAFGRVRGAPSFKVPEPVLVG